MSSRPLVRTLSYLGVAALAVTLAFVLSLKFTGSLKAQEEEAGDIPPPPPSAQEPETAPGPGQQPADAATQPSNAIAELEGFLEPFIYDVVNRRDPFLPYADFLPPVDEPLVRGGTPAQRFALEEMKLVGILWDVKDPKALFLADEEVLPLRRDDSIGNRNGYIAAIREGEVVVVEALRRRGDIIYQTKVLRIER